MNEAGNGKICKYCGRTISLHEKSKVIDEGVLCNQCEHHVPPVSEISGQSQESLTTSSMKTSRSQLLTFGVLCLLGSGVLFYLAYSAYHDNGINVSAGGYAGAISVEKLLEIYKSSVAEAYGTERLYYIEEIRKLEKVKANKNSRAGLFSVCGLIVGIIGVGNLKKFKKL